MAQMEDDQVDDSRVFDGVYFAIIPSDEITEALSNKIVYDLELEGAVHCPLSNSDKLENVTHIISSTADFPAYHDAVDAYIHVVKPAWVTQSILKGKAGNPRAYSPDPRLFLSEIVVCCADDIPQNDKDAIIAGVQAMGGQYSAKMSNLVTHVVALSMEPKQVKVILERNLRAKPVIPHWFNDCLKLGKKLHTGPYTLPNPPLFREDEALPSPYKPSRAITGAISLTPNPTPPTSPSKARKFLSAFHNSKIMLSDDLKLGKDLQQTLTKLIEKGGGRTTRNVRDATALICPYRDGKDYLAASGAGIDVGNLNWLYFLINEDKWTSPTRRLLHYPLPRQGVPNFSDYKIAVSNYSGDARIYIESLVRAAGAEFTRTLTEKNTHLIVAHTRSEKCEAALEWNVKMVNHLWMEESFAKCKEQAVTIPRYTTFPSKTNLVEVVGRTEIDREEMRRQFFPNETTSRAAKSAKSSPATAFTPTSKSKSNINVKSATKSAATTPAVGKENQTPGSRGAKARALTKLHSMAPDIALFQKELKRVGGVVYGGRRVSDPDRITLGEAGRKRSHEETEEDEQDDAEDDAPETPPPPQSTKKPRTVNRKPAKLPVAVEHPPIKVIITGFQRWIDNPAKLGDDSIMLKRLNIHLVNDSPATASFDVLVAPRMLKTRKYLAGLARASQIASTSWVQTMLDSKDRVNVEDHLLQDEKENDHLADILAKAASNRKDGGLLKDEIVFCTETLKGGWEAYEEIVRANGGLCVLYKGRETSMSNLKKKLRAVADDAEEQDDNSGRILHLISSSEDKKLWPKFREMAAASGYTPKIVTTGWLTDVAGAQDLDVPTEQWTLSR